MSKTVEENKAGVHLIVDSLQVLKGISGGGIESLKFTVQALQQAQTTLAGMTLDYWSSLADDGVITPDEKKILYKEWKLLIQEYAALVKSASEHGIPDSSDYLIDFKDAYEKLYRLVIVNLKLFDDMGKETVLYNRERFIQTYNAYYASRDALRDAIRDGEDAKVMQAAEELYKQAQADIKRVSLAGLAADSVDYEKFSSGIEQRFAGFAEDFNAMSSAFSQANKDFAALSERYQALRAEFGERGGNGAYVSGMMQTLEGLESDVASFKSDTITRFKQTDDSIEVVAGNIKKEVSASVSLEADRINELVTDIARETIARLDLTANTASLSVSDIANAIASAIQVRSDAVNSAVQDVDNKTGSIISQTKDRITQLVKSGSSEAFLSMSVGLPFWITENRFDAWKSLFTAMQDESEKATCLAYLSAVYEKVNGGSTDNPIYYYVMRDTALNDSDRTGIKSLTKKLRALNALSSIVTIDADMLQFNGLSVFSNVSGAMKIRQDFTDFSGYATEARLEGAVEDIQESISNVDDYAQGTQSDLESFMDDFEEQFYPKLNGTSKELTAFIKALMENTSDWTGTTIIDGGHIKTDLIDVQAINSKIAKFDIVFTGDISIDKSLKIPIIADESNMTEGNIWIFKS